MPRGLIFLIIFIVLLAGAAMFLAGRVGEQPTRQIEVDVTANAASR